MIRRLKKDVLTQILPKRRHIVRVPVVDEMKRRELQSCVDEVMLKSRYLLAARKGAVGKSSSSSSMQPLSDGRGTTQELASARRSLLMKLFYESGPAKMAALFTHLETFLDDKMSGKLLIFAHHQVTMNLLDTFLAQKQIDHIRIDGRTPLQQRHANVERFQTSTECRVAVLSISAAGIALTFTAASTVYFAELYWTPAALSKFTIPPSAFAAVVPSVTYKPYSCSPSRGSRSPHRTDLTIKCGIFSREWNSR